MLKFIFPCNGREAFTNGDGAMFIPNVSSKDDFAKFNSVSIMQDGQEFYVFADKAHFEGDGMPLALIKCAINDANDLNRELQWARQTVINALCTYTKVEFF